jgi:hypothetical protein
MVENTTKSSEVLPEINEETPNPVRIANGILKEQEETEGVIDFTIEKEGPYNPGNIRFDGRDLQLMIYTEIKRPPFKLPEPRLTYRHTKEDGWKLVKIEQKTDMEYDSEGLDIAEDYTEDIAQYIYDLYHDII